MENKLFLLLYNDFSSLEKSLQEEVYRDFFNLVYGISMHKLHDHTAAEDIVQETFLKTLYHAPTCETEWQLRGWIKVVTKNLTFNVLRKDNKTDNHDDIEDAVNRDLTKYAESIEKKIEIKMREEKITESLSEINPDYRKLIELKWKSGKSHQDISHELELTEGAIKQKLHRARKALKREIQKWGFQDE